MCVDGAALRSPHGLGSSWPDVKVAGSARREADDPDVALQPGPRQRFAEVRVQAVANVEQEPFALDSMAEILATADAVQAPEKRCKYLF
jgi:hypothetical protein